MEVNILLREWRECNGYEAKVLGVFVSFEVASKEMFKEMEQSQGDGWLILRKTVTDAELYNGQVLINYRIVNQNVE